MLTLKAVFPVSESVKSLHVSRFLDISYIFLYPLLFVTPLIFSLYIESTFDLAKKASLITLGGIFIISASLFIISKKNQGDESPVFIDKKIDPYVLLFILAALFSTIFSVKPSMSYNGQYSRHIGFVTYLYVFFIYFFSAQIFRGKDKTAIVVAIMETTSAAVALYALMQNFGLDPYQIPVGKGIRSVSTMGNSIFTGGFIVMMLPFSLIRIFRDKKPYAGILLSIISAGGILVTRSRAAYVSALAVTAIMFIFYPMIYRKSDKSKYIKYVKSSIWLFILTTGLIIVCIILFPGNPYVHRLMNMTDIAASTRLLLWRDSLQAFLMYPVTGAGVSAFSNVFENVMSHQLKFMEIRKYYDHAHNVFINTMVTMGTIGAVAYVLMLVMNIKVALKGFLNNSGENKDRLFFLAALASVSAYIIYSMADFENTAILLYLFTIFTLIKSKYNKYYNSGLRFSGKIINFSYVKFVILGVIFTYCSYNIYVMYNNLKADYYYKEGIQSYSNKDFNGSIRNLNTAVTSNFGCSEYKFTLADYVQSYCIENKLLEPEVKKNLLSQADAELERARLNLFSDIYYKSMKSVINFQLGNFYIAEKMKQEVLAADSLLISFRINLARYYFSVNDINKMKNELEAVYRNDPYNADAVVVSALYYISIKDKQNALAICDYYLAKEPGKRSVLELREHVENSFK